MLYTIPNFDTAGSGKALLNIATKLDKKIFEPHIACFNKKGSFFKVVEGSGIPVHIIRYTHPMDNKIKGLLHCFKVAIFFRKHHFDIIHSFHYGSDYSEGLAAKIAGVKWIYTKKNMSWGGASKNSWNLRTKLASVIAYQNSDMNQRFFRNMKNLFFIPRGVNTNEFFPGDKDISILKEFNLRDDEKIVLCVANLDAPVKGIEVLIDAFALVKDKISKLRMLLVGYDEEPYADDLKHKVVAMNLNDKIVFTGKRPDVKSFLSLADVFVLPTLSKGEGSPVSLLEAMASGVITLGSRIPGIRDQLAGFEELMFEAGNARELAEKIKWVMELSGSERNKITKRLMKNVTDNYTIEREVKDHENMYMSLISVG